MANVTRQLRIRLATAMLKSDPRAVQRYVLVMFFVLLVPAMVYGWTQARWSGALTGFIWVSGFMQLGLFALGIARQSRPENTAVGQLQRKFVWPYIIAALAGAYYGGWARGWLYMPLASLLPAIVFVVVAIRLTKSERRHGRIQALDAVATAIADLPDLSDAEAVRRQVNDAFSGLLDFCESQPAIAVVIAKHNATRRELTEQYVTLVTNGGGRAVGGYQLAALAFSNASTLNYLLSSPTTPPDRKLTDIERFLLGGTLVYISKVEGSSDEADRLAEARLSEASTAPARSTADRGSTQRKGSMLRRWFLLFRWAYLRRQLASLAGDGRFAELLDAATEAAAFVRDSLGEDDARTLLFLAAAQKEHGDYAKALATVRHAQEISDHEWEVFGKTRLGLMEQGRILLEQADGLRLAAEIQLVMGDDDGAQQDVERALDLLEKQQIRITTDPEAHSLRERSIIGCLELLGDVHRARGDFARAEPAYRGALKARQRLFGAGHGETALGYTRLALLLDQSGQFDAAEGLHDAAIKILETIPAFGDVYLPRTLLARAAHSQDVGRFDAAEQDLLAALTLLRQQNLDDSEESILTQVRLGMVYAGMDRIEPALQSFTLALNQLDRLTGQVFAVSSERQRGLYLASVAAHVETFASFVLQYLRQDTRAVGALFRLLFKYKAIGPELLAQQRESILAQRYPEFAGKLAKLTQLRGAIAEIELRRRRTPTPSSVLARLRSTRERLERELAVALPELKDLGQATPDSLGSLPDGSALVDVFRGRTWNFAAVPSRGEPRIGAARYMACILRHGRSDAVRLVDLGDAASIDALVESFRASIAGDGDRRAQGDSAALSTSNTTVRADRRVLHDALRNTMRDFGGGTNTPHHDGGDKEGRALAAAILEPLLQAADDCRRLFIAPDGDLLRLPLEVLPIGQGRRLIDDDEWQVSYLSAGRDVLRFSKGSPAPIAPALVVAAPDFDLGAAEGSSTRGTPFRTLAGIQEEGVRVSALLDVDPVLGGDALERRIKTCRSPQVLHIASHGFFLRSSNRPGNAGGLPAGAGPDRDDITGLALVDNPLLRSGLALAGANSWLGGASLPEAAENGLLTAEDVSAMDLRQTELAVLSACETGLGESQFGEGVMGLRRAFVLAGARTLVMSLWKVPDAATADLMTAFYDLLLAGVPRAEALRQAQRRLKERYPDPFYWGAFVCQGDPAAVHLSARSMGSETAKGTAQRQVPNTANARVH